MIYFSDIAQCVETSDQYFCFSTFLLHGLVAIRPLFYTVLQCHLNAVEYFIEEEDLFQLIREHEVPLSM